MVNRPGSRRVGGTFMQCPVRAIFSVGPEDENSLWHVTFCYTAFVLVR